MARILIVERVPFMRNITRFALECGGHEVIGEAEDGLQALHYFEHSFPDLVILALILPKKDGFKVLKRLKEIRKDAKVIICSSIRDEKVIDLALSHGADSYIARPFRIYNFVQEVNRILGIDEVQACETSDKVLFSEREELEKMAAKVLTKTITTVELRAFVERMKKKPGA